MASGPGCVLSQNMNASSNQGRLIRGVFRLQKTSPSIPTKYRTICVHNPEKKGFNASAQRFIYKDQNENPGPGSYEVLHKSPEFDSTSISRKGTGYFPSKDSRVLRSNIANTPAANAYAIPQRMMIRKDFSTGYSRMFQKPIALPGVKTPTPGPNEYDGSVNCCRPRLASTARSAFISKTKRDLAPMGPMKGPAPCQYTINDSMVKESTKNILSPFKSRTCRDSLVVHTTNPGPGAYHPYEPTEPVKKLIFPRRHYLCISAPAIPIPDPPPLPGPGQYEVVDFHGPSKQCVSSSAFVSNTSRWAGDISGKGIPGPATYNPQIPDKQSFLYGSGGKWIPV